MLFRGFLDFVALAQASRTTIGHHIVLRGRQVNRITRITRTIQAPVTEASGPNLPVRIDDGAHECGDIATLLSTPGISDTRLGGAEEKQAEYSKEERGSAQDHYYCPEPIQTLNSCTAVNALSIRQDTEGTQPSPNRTFAVPQNQRQNASFGLFTRSFNAFPTEVGVSQQAFGSLDPPEVGKRSLSNPTEQFSEENALVKPSKSNISNRSTPVSSTAPESRGTAASDRSSLQVYPNLGHDDDRQHNSAGTSCQLENIEQFINNSEAINQMFKSRRMSQSVYKGRGGEKGAENTHVQPSKIIFSDQLQTQSSKDGSMAIGINDSIQFGDFDTKQKPQDTDASIDSLQKRPADRTDHHESLLTTPTEMRESPVSSSRLGRIWQYAGLGASLTFGAATESLRRMTKSDNNVQGSAMLNSTNVERLVAKLSRMRGAALKMGQLLSFQDSKVLPPIINQILQRVQDSADYMPAWQRDRVLTINLGSNWRDLFSDFEERPLAAASIGQVHRARLRSNNKSVAIKIQYPGVADSIDSDLSNLSLLLTASRLLPKGLYLDRTIANARTELAWECDYVREAEATKRFAKLLSDETDIFTVPKIYHEACGPQVLTMERMEGIAVSKIRNLSQEQRNWIGTHVLRLCLREITEFRYMQTDPNWTNFLYNSAQNKIELLDFGASREYSDEFIIPYVRLLHAASTNDREECQSLSIQLGYLTGMESKTMLDAHNQSIMILAEPFKANAPSVYDFEDQTITDRVRALIPVMLQERLSPPPEETYSLHRKLSGAFLLLAKLGSKVNTKDMFAAAVKRSRFLTEQLM